MKLTVIQRISWGYGLILVSLLAITITAIISLSGVNEKLQQVTQQAGPASRISNELANGFSSVNLAMYRHYNSTDTATIGTYEQQVDDVRASYQSLIGKLHNALQNIDHKGSETERLKAIQTEAPELFNAIEQAMHTYRSSLDGQNQIRQLTEQLDRISQSKNTLFTRIDNTDATRTQQALLTDAKLQLSDGLALAQLLAETNTIQTYRTVNGRFEQWLTAYVDTGYKLSALRQNTTNADLQRLLQDLGQLVTDMVWVVSNTLGLSDTKGLYLSTRETLSANLRNNQQQLESIRDKIQAINQFTQRYSDTTAAETNTSVALSRNAIIGISVLAIVLGSFIALIIIRSIRTPLHNMVESLQRMATGDLREDLSPQSSDEFGELMQSAQSLQQSLRDMITAIQQQSHALATSIETTRSVSQKTQSDITEQKSQTDLVATAMHEMTATIREISSIAENTLNQMLTAQEHAELSQQQVADNRSVNNTLKQEMDNASNVIAKLDNDVHNIEEVIQVIDSVAQQTNLLALNAAIEAARAGEHGRGFAVVADEVRTLASRTQQSTEEIKNNIEALLNGSKQAVTAIEHSLENTDESLAMANLIHEKITDIVNNVSTTKDLNMQIATAAEEQNRTADEINRNITRIAELAEDTSSSAVHSATQLQQLDNSSHELEAMVSRFKLG